MIGVGLTVKKAHRQPRARQTVEPERAFVVTI